MATEVATVLQGLECSLCFNLLEEPKQLSCTHSFCEKCLQQLYHSQGMPMDLKCPLCRQITRLGTKGLSDLKTNVPLKSKVGDVKARRKFCSLCNGKAKSPAIHYCQQCDECMCAACLQAHVIIHKKSSHVVVSMDDIKSGKVKVKQMCQTHPGEEKLWVCTSCEVSVCFRCRMLDHSGSDHVFVEVDVFKNDMKDEIESLKKKGQEKMEKIKSYKKIVGEQFARVETIICGREAAINKAFDETLLQLKTKKNDLLDQCRVEELKLIEEICKHSTNGDDLISSISSACELVGNGVRALLKGEALEVHNNLCKQLMDMLDRDDPDESKPENVASQAEAVIFTPCRLEDEHNLGILYIKEWFLEKVADFPTSGQKTCTMAKTKNGQILVGYHDGGIEEFTVNRPQKTVLKDVKVRRISVLSDDCYVIYNVNRDISLYTSDWNKLDINEFKRKSRSQLGTGGMDVDINNNIYVGCSYNKTIEVFTPEGGQPIRVIPCHDYEPYRICTMNYTSTMLVISDTCSVRVINQQGTVNHSVSRLGYHNDYVRPIVMHDDNILIAWKKDGLLNIDLYTNQLIRMRTVINGFDCKRIGPYWALREFSSGEIALCNDSKFYVLRKSFK